MKHLYYSVFITFFLCLSAHNLNAQAFNWTKQDCKGKTWNLYNQLDSNQVVAMVFGMGCTSCQDAAGFFTGLKNQYQIAYPGKFKALYLDFWGNTCGSTVLSTGMDAEFDSCQAELSMYCSVLPMTYLVIAAGPSHSVIFTFNKKFLFEFSDTTAIKTAIENYLNSVGVKEITTTTNKISISPNPAQNKITVTNKNATEDYSVTIRNTKGELIKEKNIEAKEQSTINIEELPVAEYFITIKFRSGKEETHKLIKN